jgi:DNA-directed RNA polymerase specialized sigma24 family protein
MSASMPTPVDDELQSANAEAAGDPRLGRALLGKPEVRRQLVDFVKRRVQPADVEDVVQTVLCDALAAERVPNEISELRRWLIGIARHKVADVHRKTKREPPAELPELVAPPAPIEERELAQWAERQAPATRDAKQTLDWMAREGEGEKLESIAAEEKVPAARVRQRVSRLRRWMKDRWLAELAAVATLAIAALIAWWALRREPRVPDAVIVPEPPSAHPAPEAPPTVPPEETSPDDAIAQARATRDKALDDCAQGAWADCLRGLDAAKAQDPAGDAAPEVQKARAGAQKALEPQQPIPFKNVKPMSTSETPAKPAPKATPKSTKVLSSDDWPTSKSSDFPFPTKKK